MAIQNKTVGIIGGGISGLCAGYALRERGIQCTLYEKNPRPGGVIRSIRQDGWLVELGPNTLTAKSRRLRNLIDGLGLNEQVVRAGDEAGKRFIVKNGTPVPLPSSLMEFLKTDLLSAGAKLRLLKEPFITAGVENISVDSFFERRLGSEVADYLVNPFVAGIYAGDPQRLSMKHTFTKLYDLEQEHGSLLKGALISAGKRKNDASAAGPGGLISFRKGLGQLTDTLHQQLEPVLRLGCEIDGISKTGEGWKASFGGTAGPGRHGALIYSAPLHALASIRAELDHNSLLDELSNLRYAPIATVALGFERSTVDHPLDGFGALVPEAESRSMLGCLFSSSLFDRRAPKGHVLLTSFVGGERNPGLADHSGNVLVELVREDLESLLGISGRPRFTFTHKWRRAIPQYGLDHQSYLDRMKKLEEANPGLFFTGNFRHEVSVPGCIEQAYETAGRAASFLKS